MALFLCFSLNMLNFSDFSVQKRILLHYSPCLPITLSITIEPLKKLDSQIAINS